MTSEEFWALKIVALLHDPPGKALDLGGHEPRAFATIERIIGASLFLQLFGEPADRLQHSQDFDRLKRSNRNYLRLKRADAMASAMDRTAFPARVKIESSDYVPTAHIAHPLSGKQRPLISIPRQFCDAQGRYDQKAAHNYQLARLRDAEQLAQGQPDLRRIYLRLWRGLPSISPDVDTALLPPDTRIIDHSLWQHLDATAAVLSALPQPALLVFSVGPVQSFIAEARRTQDLWMGSYILSYLTWRGIQVLAGDVGPDAVLYPALRGQPLVDHWLHSTFTPALWDAPKGDDLAVATFPNKFVALLPNGHAIELARAAAEAVHKSWLDMAGEVKKEFPGGPQAGDWEAIWRRQVEARDWPEIYWSVLHWPGTDQYSAGADEAEAAIGLDEVYLGSPSPFRQTLKVYKQAWPTGVNSGTLYGRLHALAESGFTARKGLRDFLHPPMPPDQTRQPGEDGEKCTVSGVRSALRPEGARHREDVRRYWQGVSTTLRQTEGRYHEVKPDGSERLSAIVAIKRFAQRDYFENAIGLQGGFPSTSQVAAAPFKAAVLENLTDPALATVLCKHLEALKAMGFPTLSKEAAQLSLPRLTTLYRRLPKPLTDLGWDFLRFDADVLYPTTFTLESLEKEYRLSKLSKDDAADLAESCRRLIRTAREAGIDPPATYYAVLLMDADRMGAWLAGDGLPRFRDVLHPLGPGLFQELTDYTSDWQAILDSPRPLSAALHNSLSLALSNFALKCVPQVIENRYLGRVVYAGGDDLLAFLPTENVLMAARDLRALYSGQAQIEVGADGWQVQPDFSVDHKGFLEVGEHVLLTMGPTATASVGIVIAHHQAPLDGVLAAAREAEATAKDAYDRNAVCVYALKRSGEALRVGSCWYYPNNVPDPIGLFGKLRDYFREHKLSSKLAYDASREARVLPLRPTHILQPDLRVPPVVPLAAVESALRRLLIRHKGDQISGDETREQAKDLAARLANWAQALDGHRDAWESEWLRRHQADLRAPDPLDEDHAPQSGPVELSKWLLLARFLESGGEG